MVWCMAVYNVWGYNRVYSTVYSRVYIRVGFIVRFIIGFIIGSRYIRVYTTV